VIEGVETLMYGTQHEAAVTAVVAEIESELT